MDWNGHFIHYCLAQCIHYVVVMFPVSHDWLTSYLLLTYNTRILSTVKFQIKGHFLGQTTIFSRILDNLVRAVWKLWYYECLFRWIIHYERNSKWNWILNGKAFGKRRKIANAIHPILKDRFEYNVFTP